MYVLMSSRSEPQRHGSMTPRQLLTDALNGSIPERTPLSFGSWMTGDPYSDEPNYLFADNWKRLYDQGLCFSHHCQITRQVEHGVKETIEEQKRDGTVYTVTRKHTPIGTLQEIKRDNWVIEHWIKTHRDYEIMQWIVENTEQIACYNEYEKELQRIGDYGLIILLGSRSPAMRINVDWAGVETFCMDLALQVPELYALYEACKRLFIEETRLIAAGPGRFVKWPENLSGPMLGPRHYDELLASVYRECIPIMEQGNKRVLVHYDGALSAVADRIALAPVHILESLTEEPEGDMAYDECRAKWPDKTFWGNINQYVFELPEPQLRQVIIDKRNRAGKTAFAFEVYETLPPNWERTLPIIMDTLRSLD
jgi:hypothetical protein